MEPTQPRKARQWFLIAGTMGLLGLGLFVFVFWRDGGRPYQPLTNPTFDGRSDALQQTAVVPTLDTPIPANQSAVWCSSFQLAWNRLKMAVGNEPIQLKNAEAIAARLNQAEQTESDLDANDFYAAAGFVKDGIIQKIKTEMERKFPAAPNSLDDAPAQGAVAYGYLRAQAKFTTPFFDNDEEFGFTDSSGRRVAVKSFGIRKKDDYAYANLREQVQVLYCPEDVFWTAKDSGELIVDPCKYSRPYQLILASISRKPTLAETIADVHKKMTEATPRESIKHLHPRDTLLIPDMHWRISHRFTELEGTDKQFQNPTLDGLYLDTAFQTIQFSLDRSGAELASEAKVYVKPGATYFHFNRPFLVMLKKRDARQPFFVMWVDNAELLEK